MTGSHASRLNSTVSAQNKTSFDSGWEQPSQGLLSSPLTRCLISQKEPKNESEASNKLYNNIDFDAFNDKDFDSFDDEDFDLDIDEDELERELLKSGPIPTPTQSTSFTPNTSFASNVSSTVPTLAPPDKSIQNTENLLTKTTSNISTTSTETISDTTTEKSFDINQDNNDKLTSISVEPKAQPIACNAANVDLKNLCFDLDTVEEYQTIPLPFVQLRQSGDISVTTSTNGLGHQVEKVIEEKQQSEHINEVLSNNVHMKSEILNKSFIGFEDDKKPPRWKFKDSFNILGIPPKRNEPSTTPTVSSLKRNPTIPLKENEIELSDEQKYILDIVVNGNKSIFYTGAAGTGKSILLKSLISELRQKYLNQPDAVAITSLTGIAAININGQTLHSWAGVGLATPESKVLINALKKKDRVKAYQRWMSCRTLIVDEISMCDGDFLDKLFDIANELRGRPKFGGIQLVFVGDFYQLPPVPGRDKFGKILDPPFAFESRCWKSCISAAYELKTIFRQSGDLEFIDMLNHLRTGNISNHVEAKFRKLARPIKLDKDVKPTILYPLNKRVDQVNEKELRDLPVKWKTRTYKAIDTNRDKDTEFFFKGLRIHEEVKFKIGAQVMCLANYPEGPVNGSLGKIIGFIEPWLWRLNTLGASEDASKDILGITESALPILPLERLFEVIEMAKYHVGDAFSTYKNDEEYNNLDEFERKVYRRYTERMSESEVEFSSNVSYPIVDFIDIGPTLVLRKRFELPSPVHPDVSIADRFQVPLSLAWALSIHKSQGQTLQYARVDVSNAFEAGQVYVALSRAVSKEGLQVTGFSKKVVTVNPTVVNFYRNLTTIKYDKNEISPSELYERLEKGPASVSTGPLKVRSNRVKKQTTIGSRLGRKIKKMKEHMQDEQ